MDDAQVKQRIEELVEEEHRLWDAESAGRASDDDRRRLDELKVSLDLCWDLLRQRRALEQYGRDPDLAGPRSAETVENYEQ
jgi:Protein of unknown function (DUF2630)